MPDSGGFRRREIPAKKTHKAAITRSKNGCLTCRKRHTKCDETKPLCLKCTRLNLDCEGYAPPSIIFRDDTVAVTRRSETIEAQKLASRRATDRAKLESRCQSRQERTSSASSTSLTSIKALDTYDDLQLGSVRDSTVGLDSPPDSASEFTGQRSNSPTPRPSQSVLKILSASLSVSPSSSRASLWSRKQYKYSSMIAPQCCSSLDHNDLDADATGTFPARGPLAGHDMVTDTWLSNNFPPQLPRVFREIWDTIGYANIALKYALLALVPPGKESNPIINREEGNSRRLQWYNLALREMSPNLLCSMNTSQVLVQLAILAIFLQIEAKLGTFIGGFSHYLQADNLVAQNITALANWELAQRLLVVWVSMRSWYASQCGPWSQSGALADDVQRQIWGFLRTSPHQILQLLLCESHRISTPLIIGRLVGVNDTWPTYRSWCQQLLNLGLGVPKTALYNCSEDELLRKLDEIRGELDAWHEALPADALPLWGMTAASHEKLKSLPPALRLQPLRFRNHQAAMDYLCYAAAQALCSRDSIDACSGSDLATSYLDPWITVCLQILAGLDWEKRNFDEEDLSEIGLMWILQRVFLYRNLSLDVVTEVERLLPRLDELEVTNPGSTCPLWMLRAETSMIKSERARGRVVLFTLPEIGPTEEWSLIYSTPLNYRTIIIGRNIPTGASFREIIEISACSPRSLEQ